VLLVDDDVAVRETAAAVLQAQGYAVTEVAEARQALGLLRGGAPFDVLVTDVVMPGMTGPELIRELRLLRPKLPAVMISGYTEPADLTASGGPGFFVRKPFTPNALSATIEAAMSQAAA
jgi:CheY-like chemotaxis protein